MRYSYIFSVLAATAALAGKVDNAINIPRDGYNIEAGKDTTLTWNPSTDGTVTIKLQDMTNNDVVTPNDGIVLAQNIDNTGSYNVKIPDNLKDGKYAIEIIDDSNQDNMNFTPKFSISNDQGKIMASTSASGSASSTASQTSQAATTSGASSTQSSAASSPASSNASSSAPKTRSTTSGSAPTTTGPESTSAENTQTSSSAASTSNPASTTAATSNTNASTNTNTNTNTKTSLDVNAMASPSTAASTMTSSSIPSTTFTTTTSSPSSSHTSTDAHNSTSSHTSDHHGASKTAVTPSSTMQGHVATTAPESDGAMRMAWGKGSVLAAVVGFVGVMALN